VWLVLIRSADVEVFAQSCELELLLTWRELSRTCASFEFDDALLLRGS